MANCKRELIYYCNDDCNQGGCTGHIASLRFQSCSSWFFFDIGGKQIAFGSEELQALIDLIKALNRCGVVNL